MANEIALQHKDTAATLYAILRDTTGQVCTVATGTSHVPNPEGIRMNAEMIATQYRRAKSQTNERKAELQARIDQIGVDNGVAEAVMLAAQKTVADAQLRQSLFMPITRFGLAAVREAIGAEEFDSLMG